MGMAVSKPRSKGTGAGAGAGAGASTGAGAGTGAPNYPPGPPKPSSKPNNQYHSGSQPSVFPHLTATGVQPYPWCTEQLWREERLLVFGGTSGTGNSMHSLVSTLLVAAATCRTLVHEFGDWFQPLNGSLVVTLIEQVAPDVREEINTLRAAVFKAGDRVKSPVPCSVYTTHHVRADSMFKRLLATGVTVPDPWPLCRIISLRGNQYYAPYLLDHPNMSAFYRLVASTLTGGSHTPYFGPATRSLLVPLPSITRRVDHFIAGLRSTSHRTALGGVHIRARFLETATYNQIQRSSNLTSVSGKFEHLFAKGFRKCVEQVRSIAHSQGFNRSRVYIAADNDIVRDGAQSILGADFITVPTWINGSIPATADEISLSPRRSNDQKRAAFDEMLVPARMDAIVVRSMKQSTYSSVAASWFAHRAVGAQPSPGLGVLKC